MTKKIKRYCLGYGLLFLGVLGGLLPIIQGWMFVIAGLLVLKDDLAITHRLIHYLRGKFPKLEPSFVKAEEKVDVLLVKWGLKG